MIQQIFRINIGRVSFEFKLIPELSLKCITSRRYFHHEEDHNSIWHHYYAEISPPSKVIKGENQKVTATDKKCFTYICIFTNLQVRAIKFSSISDYSFLLIENVFNKGPGTVYIQSSSKSNIIIDKFCSFESKTPTDGHFTYFYGKINSTILQGSISNGGNSNGFRGMICQEQGFSSVSKTNISNCISYYSTAFYYYKVESTTNVSFCNFENLESRSAITQFDFCDGRIERCNYINNFQIDSICGLVYVNSNRVDVFDSFFQNNIKDNIGKLFYSYSGGQIYIYRCNVDKYSASYDGNGFVDTSSMTTDSFSNDLKFIVLSPCEGELSNVHDESEIPIVHDEELRTIPLRPIKFFYRRR